ncbi:MAG: TrkH family potassium uptake protein [Rubrimonas sp.]
MRSDALGAELRTAVFATSCVWFILAAAMLIPAAVDLAYDSGDWKVFAISSGLVTALAGLMAFSTRGLAPPPTQRFGFIIVAMLWIATPVAGATPFLLFGMSPMDALFESVSGFTTTGATVMVGLDDMPPGILLWRSISQFLGGVGILALGLALLPFLRIGGMQLFSKESSERGDRPLPRFAPFARSLISVYGSLFVLCALSYAAVGMSAFDAVNHAMTTVSTAGFSTYDASMGHFVENGPLWVGSIFMVLGALPFALYIAVLFGRRPSEIDPQIIVFIGIVAAASLSLAAMIDGGFDDREFAQAVFNVVSIITTSGFAAGDYTLNGPFAVALFFILMFLGGCAGSTTGGIKTYRLVVTWALMRAHLRRLVMPNAVVLTRYGARQVDPAVFRSALVYLVAFALCLMLLTLALAACGLDLLTAHSAALTALANVGPGLGPIIGPSGNFSSLPDLAKLLISMGMILGRLEILPILVMLTPEFWRR